MDKQTKYLKIKKVLTRDKLYDLLWEKGYTYKKISTIYDIDQHYISILAKEYNIPKNKKAIGESHWEIAINKDELLQLYICEKKSIREIAKYFGCVHGVISKRLQGLDIDIRNGNDIEYYKNRRHKESKPYIDHGGYVLKSKHREHRLVMEKHIGRKLLPNEHVHHIDFNKTNNELENLFLFSENQVHHIYHGYIKYNKYISPQYFMDNFYEQYKITLFNYNWLYENYITQNKSANKIAKEINIHRNTVCSRLKKEGIWELRIPTVNQFF